MAIGSLHSPHELFCPSEPRAMNIVAFGSGSGTNLEAVLRDQKKWRDPPFRVAALFSDRSCRFLEIGKELGIPTIHHSFTSFFSRYGCTNMRDPELRGAYEEEAIELLDALDFPVDLILLAGYMRLLYPPLLHRYSERIINVHPADLTAIDAEGKRRYTGANAVYDALTSGASQTRSTVHLVTDEVDGGPILISGPWVPYTGVYPVTQEAADAHQDKQKRLSDWPAVTEAIELIGQRRLSITDEGCLFLDGNPMSPAGVVM